MFDILWSDPQHNEGCRPNGLRGAGTYFGPDVSLKFLHKYKLEFLVRSHECKHDGYEIMHSGKVPIKVYGSYFDFLLIFIFAHSIFDIEPRNFKIYEKLVTFSSHFLF